MGVPEEPLACAPDTVSSSRWLLVATPAEPYVGAGVSPLVRGTAMAAARTSAATENMCTRTRRDSGTRERTRGARDPGSSRRASSRMLVIASWGISNLSAEACSCFIKARLDSARFAANGEGNVSLAQIRVVAKHDDDAQVIG